MPDTVRWFFTRNVELRLCFVAYDSADHVTPKTGLTGFTVKATYGYGGALLSFSGAVVTEIGEGVYYLSGGTVPDSTNDQSLMLKISATGMDPVFISGWISAFNPGDQVKLGMTALPNAIPGTLGGVLISGTTQNTVATNGIGYVGVYANGDKIQYELSASALAAIKDAVWNATIASFVTAGTFGKKISDWVLDPWDVSLPGAYGSGKAGRILGLNLDTTVSSRSSLDAGTVATSVLAALDNPNIELGAIPTSTSGLKAMIQYIFAYFRNKRSASSSVETLYAEDATTPLGTASISDSGGTVTKGEMS